MFVFSLIVDPLALMGGGGNMGGKCIVTIRFVRFDSS